MKTERPVALISGGSRGLGRALVEDLADDGHIVVTFSRTATEFIEERQRQDPEGQSFLWQAVDLGDFDSVEAFVLSVARRYGRIDALINNAAVGADGLLALMRPADIARAITLNLEGAIRLTRICSRVMLQQTGGSIINISSVNALRGHAGVSVYSATKAAMDGFTRSLARELGESGIRVNSLAPGYFESEMTGALTPEQKRRIVRRTPLGRLGTLDDMTAVIRFLLSPASSFVTGQTLSVDGGISC